MLSSIYLLNKKTLRKFFNTYSLMLDSREKGRKKKNSTATLRFQRWREKEKCLLYHPVEEKNIISWRQDHSLEHPVLKTFVASIESPYICPSSTLRTKATRRTILDLLDQPAQTRPSFLLLWLQKHRMQFSNICLNSEWIWEKHRHEENSSVSFFSSHHPYLQLLKKPDSSEN